MVFIVIKFILFCSLFFTHNFLKAIDVQTDNLKNWHVNSSDYLCLKEVLAKIPIEDYLELEDLFYVLVNHDHFAYTLFGDKPVSIGAYFKVTPWENVIELEQCDGVFWRKWAVWEKYKSQFKIKNYLFFKDTSSIADEIVVINKKMFVKTIAKNLHVFEEIMREKINPEQFLEKIEQGKISFYESIQHNTILLGILLGYGKHNAMLFYQKNKICKQTCLSSFCRYPHSLSRIKFIGFMADHHHPETERLNKQYQKLHGKISVLYAKGNFLEVTLAQLISE